jgi:hypothetical protein
MIPQLLLVWTLALAVRLAYLVFVFDEGPPDIYYWELADSLLHHGVLGFDGRPSTFIGPGYPLFLAAARWISGDRLLFVRLIQIAVSATGSVFLFLLTLRLSGRRSAAFVAALLYATSPYYVGRSASIIEVPVFTPLLIAAVWAFVRIADARSALVCGVIFGVTLVTRWMVAPAWACLALLVLWRRGFVQAAALLLGTVAIVAPAAWRSYRIDRTIVPPRSGLNLFVGNSEYSSAVLPAYDTDLLTSYAYARYFSHPGALPVTHPGFDKDVDRFLTEITLEHVTAHPWDTLRLKLRNVLYFFNIFRMPYYPMGLDTHLILFREGRFRVEGVRSRDDLGSWPHRIFYGTLLVGAATGLFLRRALFERDVVLHLLLASFVAVYAVYWPSTRNRAPVTFVLMFFTACAAAALLDRMRHRAAAAPASAAAAHAAPPR